MALSVTSLLPYLTSRMQKMANSFQDNNYVDLMEVLYQLADEDLIASRRIVNKKSLESSMGRLCRDKLNDRHAFQLLLSIPPIVIQHIIKGDVAYWLKTSAEFEKSLYKMDMTHGIYLYSFTINRPDESTHTLTRLEILAVVAMMKRYKETRGTPGNDEAVKIDNAYKSSSTNGADTRNEGTRVLLGGNNGKAIESLCNTLLQRWHEEDDFDGDTRQQQAPCGVGYSKTLLSRGSKPTGETLWTSNKPWTLFMSCLKSDGTRRRKNQHPDPQNLGG